MLRCNGSVQSSVMFSNMQPFFFQGPSWVGDTDKLHIVLRFMGTTPFTSTISSVLSSVTEQLQRSVVGKVEPNMPQNFIDIKDLFMRTLDLIGSPLYKDHQVILVLDSIDQLSALHGAHELGWLPTSLPSNVKLILSTLPEEHGILKNMKVIQTSEKQYVHVEELSYDDCQNILHLWLEQAKRKITPEQEELFKSKILKKNIRPLYLKLIFDEIITWKSFEKDDQLSSIKPDIESSILQLYDRLERKHGGKTNENNNVQMNRQNYKFED